jgi:2-succinyl-6-hydroxy-2,4-cyclohexadiene-1-carboxylate synthase
VQRLAHQLRVLGQGAQEPLWDRLGELAMPVLLVAGGYDRAYSETAQRMATAIGSNAEVTILPRAGHAVHLEQPNELAQLLASWAATVGLIE